MTPKEKAKEMFKRHLGLGYDVSKQIALNCVDEIIAANPHSNPLNTEPVSTMEWWQQVKEELKKI